MREGGNHPDAAFNLEYLLFVRDELAKSGRPAAPRAQAPEKDGPAAAQQTLHGREGAPPSGRSQKEFKVYVPEDRDEQKSPSAPGSDEVRQRKG